MTIGFELGENGTNDTPEHKAGSSATEKHQAGAQLVMAMFVIWGLIKVGIWLYFAIQKCSGKVMR